jgi:hypothetical protein
MTTLSQRLEHAAGGTVEETGHELFSALLELDELDGLREISHRGGGTVWLYRGGRRLRPATDEERRTAPVMSVWRR